MTLFSKSYVSYGVKVKFCVCYQVSGAVCIFSRIDRSWTPLRRVYPKSAKSIVIEYTQEILFCAGETRFNYFSGQVFLYVLQTKMIIASGSENNVSLAPQALTSRRETLYHSICELFPVSQKKDLPPRPRTRYHLSIVWTANKPNNTVIFSNDQDQKSCFRQ